MNRYCTFVLLWLTGSAWASEQEQVLRIPAVHPEFHTAQDYFVGLLRRALVKGADGQPVPQLVEQLHIEQGRALHELTRGRLLDIYWMGTSPDREQQLRAIRIPLVRGLEGYRRFIIHRSQRKTFDGINSLADLRGFKACQGLDWPDTAIMRAAELSVRELAGYETILQRLGSLQCDYFPRAYFETHTELAQFQQEYPDLEEYDSLILHYPLAIYFFVKRDNEALAQWITRGLERMIDDGEFVNYLRSQALTRTAFPLKKPGRNASGKPVTKRMIAIPNPGLTEGTNYRNKRYWYQPGDFNVRRLP